jgi:hypothetical protein
VDEHAIFISYRRDDTGGEAGRLFDDLTRTFGSEAVFMDVSGIAPGVDFRKVIDQNVSCCGVQLAIIGPTWATITGSSGARRLDDPNDYVRLEIASALSRNIAVIPVLVHGARMPHADQLPDNLKDLAYRNSVELTLPRWSSDVQLLIQALTQYVHTNKATEADTVHANLPVQLPPPHATPETAQAETKLKKPLKVGLIAVAVVVIAVIGFFAFVMLYDLHYYPSDKAASPLDGRWTNPSANGRDSVAQLEISGGSNQLAVHAWGLCKPANCDWGTQNATFDGQKAKATWSLLNDASGEEKGRVATLTISPGGSGKLEVTVENTYPQHAGNTHQFEFVSAK